MTSEILMHYLYIFYDGENPFLFQKIFHLLQTLNMAAPLEELVESYVKGFEDSVVKSVSRGTGILCKSFEWHFNTR